MGDSPTTCEKVGDLGYGGSNATPPAGGFISFVSFHSFHFIRFISFVSFHSFHAFMGVYPYVKRIPSCAVMCIYVYYTVGAERSSPANQILVRPPDGPLASPRFCSSSTEL